MKKLLGTIVAAILLAAPQMAMGQEGSPQAKHPKRTIIEFDPDEVIGDLPRPDHGTVLGRAPAPQPTLIRVRDHFMPELIKSADDV